MKRTIRLTLVLALAVVLGLAGCTASQPADGPSEQPADPAVTPAKITIGTLATQDSLPLWVADDKGYFAEAGLPEVEIVTFQSAQESQTAFVSGAVDALMTDLIVSANLHGSGTPVIVPTVMLGATTEQGRFAIVAAPGSDVTSMTDLAGVPVGTASATITEYVLDMLMAEAGVAAADVVKEEVQKMPIRFQLVMSDQLAAAALPEPFVTLAELEGATVVPGGDDTKASSNLSQSVLCVNKEYADTPEGGAAVSALLEAWNAAVADINADPDAFRTTLVSKAGLPEPLADSYEVSEYPLAAPPAAADVQKVLDWMDKKGYLQAPVTPADILP